MSKKVGIVICNYNKQMYIVKCIESVLKSSFHDFDIYVVDNASTDDSVKEIREHFGTQVILLENKENLGGSGGFNTGLREALKREYEYLMLVDNDIVMDPHAIEELYCFLEKHAQVGLVGAEIYQMDHPEEIMALGAVVDYEKYCYEDCYRGYSDSDDIPEVNYCDYVPACTLMVRRSVVDEVGILDEGNFIYWDDIEWAKRIRVAGHQVAAIRAAKIWHKGGGGSPTNTFPIYYYIRNAIRFFAKYIPEDKMDSCVDGLLADIFQRIYGSFLKGKNNYVATIVRAYEDALQGISGKAKEGIILPLVDNRNNFLKYLAGKNNILVQLTDTCSEEKFGKLKKFVAFLEKKCVDKSFTFSTEKCAIYHEGIKEQLNKEYHNKFCVVIQADVNDYDLVLRFCKHVREITALEENIVFVDCYTNAVGTEDELLFFKSYQTNLEFFQFCNHEYFKTGMLELKKIQSRKLL